MTTQAGRTAQTLQPARKTAPSEDGAAGMKRRARGSGRARPGPDSPALAFERIFYCRFRSASSASRRAVRAAMALCCSSIVLCCSSV